jgi:hypothetical protein
MIIILWIIGIASFAAFWFTAGTAALILICLAGMAFGVAGLIASAKKGSK